MQYLIVHINYQRGFLSLPIVLSVLFLIIGYIIGVNIYVITKKPIPEANRTDLRDIKTSGEKEPRKLFLNSIGDFNYYLEWQINHEDLTGTYVSNSKLTKSRKNSEETEIIRYLKESDGFGNFRIYSQPSGVAKVFINQDSPGTDGIYFYSVDLATGKIFGVNDIYQKLYTWEEENGIARTCLSLPLRSAFQTKVIHYCKKPNNDEVIISYDLVDNQVKELDHLKKGYTVNCNNTIPVSFFYLDKDIIAINECNLKTNQVIVKTFKF